MFRPAAFRIDRGGELWYGSIHVTHPRVLEACLVRLIPSSNGGVELQDRGAKFPVSVEDTPLVVRRLVLQRDGRGLVAGGELVLGPGLREELRPDSVEVRPDGVFETRVRGGLRARFLPLAQQQIAELLMEDDDGVRLVVGGAGYLVGGGELA